MTPEKMSKSSLTFLLPSLSTLNWFLNFTDLLCTCSSCSIPSFPSLLSLNSSAHQYLWLSLACCHSLLNCLCPQTCGGRDSFRNLDEIPRFLKSGFPNVKIRSCHCPIENASNATKKLSFIKILEGRRFLFIKRQYVF